MRPTLPVYTRAHLTYSADFDFPIDLTCQIVHGPVHWSLPDEEPAYRGAMFLEVDGAPGTTTGDPEALVRPGRRAATKAEKRAAKERKTLRMQCGLPPWVAPAPEAWAVQQESGLDTSAHAPAPAVVLKSSKTLREDRKSTRLNSSHSGESRMPSSA